MSTAGTAPESGKANALRAAVGVVLFSGALAVTLHKWVGIGFFGLGSVVDGPVYDAVVISAGFACLLKARSDDSERGAWLVIAASVFAWAFGDTYWTAFIEGNSEAPYPSPGDIGYVAFYPLAAAGVYKLLRARAHELDWRLWMDGLIAALGTAALGAALIFEFVAHRTSGTTIQVATTLSYPLGDIVLVAMVVGVAALTRWRPGRTWILLLAGLATMGVADVAFTLQSYEATVPGGDWVEPLYLISAVFIGAVAWQGRTDAIQPVARFDGWRELMVPGLFAVVMIVLVAMQYFRGASGLTTALWSATMLAVVVRLAISVSENKRLLEQVRTDALTGLGNQGRLQVDLRTRCERAETEPLTLLLLDLNGFKRYNDTFGHPAGDDILRRLGTQLGDAVGDVSDAYRVGGDEFAVLIGGPAESHDAIAKRAAEALTASGKGFEISAAWGAAAIPAEAEEPLAAMQLADVRMYAQKESRRVAHGPDLHGEELTVRLSRPDDREALEQGK